MDFCDSMTPNIGTGETLFMDRCVCYRLNDDITKCVPK